MSFRWGCKVRGQLWQGSWVRLEKESSSLPPETGGPEHGGQERWRKAWEGSKQRECTKSKVKGTEVTPERKASSSQSCTEVK